MRMTGVRDGRSAVSPSSVYVCIAIAARFLRKALCFILSIILSMLTMSMSKKNTGSLVETLQVNRCSIFRELYLYTIAVLSYTQCLMIKLRSSSIIS